MTQLNGSSNHQVTNTSVPDYVNVPVQNGRTNNSSNIEDCTIPNNPDVPVQNNTSSITPSSEQCEEQKDQLRTGSDSAVVNHKSLEQDINDMESEHLPASGMRNDSAIGSGDDDYDGYASTRVKTEG